MLECQNQTCQTLTRTIDSYLTQTGHPETPWAATSSKKLQGQKNCHIYICDGWSKFLYPGTAILREQRIIFRESFANSRFICRGTHVEQQLLFWRFIHHLLSHKIITDNFFIDRLLLIRQFLQGSLHSLQNALWLSPTLSRNFRGTFTKMPLSADISRGSLAAAFGACFLRLQKATLGSTSGRCKDVLRDHGIWLWPSRGEASPSEAWLLPMLRYHSPAGPREPLTSCNVYNDS